MTAYEHAKKALVKDPKKWLITGVAGFIGSNLLEHLLELDQEVIGLDNFLTGHKANLEEVKSLVTPVRWKKFTLIEGDILNIETCQKACDGVDYVLHQAALGSVPRSIENPVATNESNVTGFLNMIAAARDAHAKRFVYASSSSVYGDNSDLPQTEQNIGKPLSPYAVTKQINELYADIFSRAYGFNSIGLRYFNVFGPRQDPEGPYAAVIPRWFSALIQGAHVYIYGDGETSRDFCFVENVVQANILAAYAGSKDPITNVFNIAFGERTTLNGLFELIRDIAAKHNPRVSAAKPRHEDFRPGDIRHSLADISRAGTLLGYEPGYSVRSGLEKAAAWYFDQGQK